MRSRGLTLALAATALAGCPRDRAPAAGVARDAAPTPAADLAADVAALPDVPHETVGPGARGPWSDARLAGAAASPAVPRDDGRAVGLVAVSTADQRAARLSWVAWGPRGAEILAQTNGPGMSPGAAIALVPRAGGWTAVWSAVEGDAGEVARAIELSPAGFAGATRPARDDERAAARWTSDAMTRRARDRLDMPPAESVDDARATLERRGGTTVVRLDGVEVLRGGDLEGYAQAITVASRGETRFVALSRGRCRDARVELWAVRDGTSSLRASFPIGVEVGVRWLRVEPGARAVAVTWYQDLIPLRIACARGDGGATRADHGVRVALVVE